MTLGSMLMMIAAVAIALTLLTGFVLKAQKSWLMTFLQHFCGSLFIWSGYVKAVDPMGTAIKMEQYFAEFEQTASGSFLSFLAPVFPFLSSHSLAFSLLIILFEIVLGLFVVLGIKPKFTVWSFMILVVFFTVLTGYTYLTGYVPSGVNFFDFGQWADYNSTNMKVTDCGCFGDFIKLEPKISFFKDLFLLIPAFYFLLRRREMHQLFTPMIRNVFAAFCFIGLSLFCYRNTVMDEPIQDFRPFKAGVNIREVKAKEEEAENAVKIIAYKLTDKKTGKVTEVPFDQFLKEISKYPSEQYDFDQIKTEPAIKKTKISEFAIYDTEGNEFTEDLLNAQKPIFLIIIPKLYGSAGAENTVVQDTVWTIDSTKTDANGQFQKSVVAINKVTQDQKVMVWDPQYVEIFGKTINPFVEEAEKGGVKTLAVVAGVNKEDIEDFRHTAQTSYPFFTADDVLLKTIMRSNPGVVLIQNGKIIQKWHYRKLPTFAEVSKEYLGK